MKLAAEALAFTNQDYASPVLHWHSSKVVYEHCGGHSKIHYIQWDTTLEMWASFRHTNQQPGEPDKPLKHGEPDKPLSRPTCGMRQCLFQHAARRSLSDNMKPGDDVTLSCPRLSDNMKPGDDVTLSCPRRSDSKKPGDPKGVSLS
jgi:hypothetical protein